MRRFFSSKKRKESEFKAQFRAGANKALALDSWERQGLLRVDPDTMRVIIHYLLWHLWSAKGIVKLCNSLYFFTNIKRVNKQLPPLEHEYLTIAVDYTQEPNDYGKQGVVKMVEFHPKEGFREV